MDRCRIPAESVHRSLGWVAKSKKWLISYAQVVDAVGVYAGIEPATVPLEAECSTI